VQKVHYLVEQNGRVCKHASLDSQFRVIVIRELLVLHAI
jgi:hypothetical protein